MGFFLLDINKDYLLQKLSSWNMANLNNHLFLIGFSDCFLDVLVSK